MIADLIESSLCSSGEIEPEPAAEDEQTLKSDRHRQDPYGTSGIYHGHYPHNKLKTVFLKYGSRQGLCQSLFDNRMEIDYCL